MKQLVFTALGGAILAHAAELPRNICPRPPAGSAVGEPIDLRSLNGELKVDLTIHNSTGADGSARYCYVDGNGNPSPTLRLKPGDLLILRLKNELTVPDSAAAGGNHIHAHAHAGKSGDPCASGAMTATSTNLHFHGLTIPPVCHQDDVLKTSISPLDPPFEYRFRIPTDEPPGLYWYMTNPEVSPANPYVPDNSPVISDLFDLFSFGQIRQ